ncbi:MAG: NIPSNAP family protein [Bryobacteraceae bacterium]
MPVFELRTYFPHEGKLEPLLRRFRDHTIRIFDRHGIASVGYWISCETLIYIVSHASREAAKQNWDAFRADPEWKRIAAESEANGKLVNRIDSVFMDATDFSAIK